MSEERRTDIEKNKDNDDIVLMEKQGQKVQEAKREDCDVHLRGI